MVPLTGTRKSLGELHFHRGRCSSSFRHGEFVRAMSFTGEGMEQIIVHINLDFRRGSWAYS